MEEGIEYVEGIKFEPDSSIYPLEQYASSQRYPYRTYGFQQLFDNDSSTSWETMPGTSLHEFVYFRFDSLPCKSLKINFCKDIRHVFIDEIKIWINGVYYGFAPPVVTIENLTGIQTLLIEIAKTEGLNLSHLSVSDDSTKNRITEELKSGNLYSSKPAGISEILFYNEARQKLNVKAIPVRMAKISGEKDAFHTEFFGIDNILHSTVMYEYKPIQLQKNDALLFSFPDDQVISRIQLGCTSGNDENKFSFNLRFRKPNEYVLQKTENPQIFELKYPLKGKNYEFISMSDYSGDIQFHSFSIYDGSRWINVKSDSVEIKSSSLKDSMKYHLFGRMLNSYVEHSEKYSLYYLPLKELKKVSGKKSTLDTLPYFTSIKKIGFSMKSDLNCVITQTRQLLNLKNSAENLFDGTKFIGKFRISQKQADRIDLELYGYVIPLKDENSYYMNLPAEKRQIKVSITPRQVIFESVFDGFTYLE